ncbi:DNA-binding protein [Methylobacterium sp. Leaf104]|nr:DNA-binding protein [Methylobacterium sp. Leaf104]MCI9882199.1 DNA-binding protein [Methylobacterium goesingense]
MGGAWLLGIVLGVCAGLPGPAGAAAPECLAAPAREDRLAGLGPRGELMMASGAKAVLDGVRWSDAPEIAAEAHAWLLARSGRPLTLVARGEIDRWGRSHVDAVEIEPAAEAAPDLAAGLVALGLVAVDAGERDTLCRPALLAVEAGARRSGSGLWRRAVPDVRDGAALRNSLGRFVVAQGPVLWVGERPRRTYLDFARRGEDGLTVTVSKRTWRALQERGLSAASLRGRHVRVRGVLEAWRGPTLDIASADMIEVLDGEQAQRR